MKLTKEQKNKIKELKEKGKTPKEISEQLEIPYATTLYHSNQDVRKKQIENSLKYQRNNPQARDYEKYKKYQKKYQNNYYHNPENHERLKEYHREYQRERYRRLNGNQIN